MNIAHLYGHVAFAGKAGLNAKAGSHSVLKKLCGFLRYKNPYTVFTHVMTVYARWGGKGCTSDNSGHYVREQEA